MTQEEKFEEAKRLYETANADQRYVLESLFPELKGSEDERIRKALIGFLKSPFVNESITDEEVTPWIAWLEKQGVEPKKLKKAKFKTGDRIIGIVSGMQYYITEICDNYYNTESGCIIMFSAQENFEFYKQNPTWSEKDEEILDLTLFYLERYVKMKDVSKCETWLNSLRLQKQWKPSDEQMKALEESIMFLGTSWVSARQFALESLYQDLKKLK